MKRLILIISLIAFVPCNSQMLHPEYVEVSGKIVNVKSTEFLIFGGRYSKSIKINEDGTFKDTLKLGTRKYQIIL